MAIRTNKTEKANQIEKKRKKKHRGHGEGSCYYREDKKLWVAQVTIDGKTRQVYGKSQAEALEKKKAIEAAVIKGTYAEPSKVTLEIWLHRWLEVFVKPLRDTTYDNYETHVRVHINPGLGKKTLQALRPSDLQKFLNDKQVGGRVDGKPGGLAVRTVRMLHFILHAALEQAKKEGLVGRNVAEDVTPPKQGKRAPQYLTGEELIRFMEVAAKSRHFAALMTEIGTGLRRGEVLGLQWDCVDLDAPTITVRRSLVRRNKGGPVIHEPKTDAGNRTVTLPAELVSILKRHRAAQAQERLICGQAYENNNLVFCQANGRRIEPRCFTRQFDAMLEKAKIKHVPFHSLRHSHATELLRMGVDLKTIQGRLGHSSFHVTADFYAHIADELQRDAAEKINGLLMAGQRNTMEPATG